MTPAAFLARIRSAAAALASGDQVAFFLGGSVDLGSAPGTSSVEGGAVRGDLAHLAVRLAREG